MTNYSVWENQLNNHGLHADIEVLENHLMAAPGTRDPAEIKTINLLKEVIATRKRGGDITKIICH